MLANLTILVTGGTGSFGSAFVRRILEDHQPVSVRILSRGEERQRQLKADLDDDRVRFLLGDVRDRDRLTLASRGVDVIIHAAALKQIPACEADPFECVQTNVIGAENVVWAAIANGVPRTISLSSDKACHPVNLYGSCKLTAEKIITAANTYDHIARFASTRWGNVIASTGSVIPLFKAQAETGEITITDEAMTRFWMTLDQAVDFVLESLERMKGGEIFIPRMESKRVVDLAEEVAPGVPRRIIGIRPGEKIHEVLITSDEARHTRAFPGYFVVYPSFRSWDADYPSGEELPPGFSYTSHRDSLQPSLTGSTG